MPDLKEMAAKWMRNKQEIGFQARAGVSNGSVCVLLDEAPRKYVKAIRSLAQEMLLAGAEEMAQAFSYPTAPGDAVGENGKIREYLETRKCPLLDILLEEGYAPFRKEVAFEASVLRMQYELGTMQYGADGWKRWDGSCLTPGGWSRPDGIMEAAPYGEAAAVMYPEAAAAMYP